MRVFFIADLGERVIIDREQKQPLNVSKFYPSITSSAFGKPEFLYEVEVDSFSEIRVYHIEDGWFEPCMWEENYDNSYFITEWQMV